MNNSINQNSHARDLNALMINERHRTIKEMSRALIACLRLEEESNITLRLNSQPAKNMADAVSTFVRDQSCALSNIEIVRAFDVIQHRLEERISDLYDSGS